MIDRRLRLGAGVAEEAARAIGQRLLNVGALGTARAVGLYGPIRGEVPVRECFTALRRKAMAIYFPRVAEETRLEFARIDAWEQLVRGYRGICEPDPSLPAVPIRELDVLVIPGVAFDLEGRRLGWGKGFYDRALRGYRGFRIGLAYDFQILESLPEDPHDERVDAVISEKRLIP